VGALLLDHYVRGAVSGIGLVCLAAAVASCWPFWAAAATTTAPDLPLEIRPDGRRRNGARTAGLIPAIGATDI